MTSSPLSGDDLIKWVSAEKHNAYTLVSGDTEIVQHFKAKELACTSNKPDERGVLRIDKTFLIRLSCLRSIFGSAMKITSCSRTPVHNIDVDGHIDSLHLTESEKYYYTNGGAATVTNVPMATLAVDVSVYGWYVDKVHRCVALAKTLGYSIGYGFTLDKDNKAEGFLHLDLRSLLGLTQVEFYYE